MCSQLLTLAKVISAFYGDQPVGNNEQQILTTPQNLVESCITTFLPVVPHLLDAASLLLFQPCLSACVVSLDQFSISEASQVMHFYWDIPRPSGLEKRREVLRLRKADGGSKIC